MELSKYLIKIVNREDSASSDMGVHCVTRPLLQGASEYAVLKSSFNFVSLSVGSYREV